MVNDMTESMTESMNNMAETMADGVTVNIVDSTGELNQYENDMMLNEDTFDDMSNAEDDEYTYDEAYTENENNDDDSDMMQFIDSGNMATDMNGYPEEDAEATPDTDNITNKDMNEETAGTEQTQDIPSISVGEAYDRMNADENFTFDFEGYIHGTVIDVADDAFWIAESVDGNLKYIICAFSENGLKNNEIPSIGESVAVSGTLIEQPTDESTILIMGTDSVKNVSNH